MLFTDPVVITTASGGPNWTDILTAIGTVGAVMVALGIAWWSDRKSDKRIKDERQHSDQVLADQRKLDSAEIKDERDRGDRILADQREHEKAAVEEERAHGRAQLDEERRLTREREQLAQAYLVQVVLAQQDGEVARDELYNEPLGPAETKRLAVMVVNRGSYTITRLEAQFCMGRSMTPHHRYVRMSGLTSVPQELRKGYEAAPELSLHSVLTPFDKGIRFETDVIHQNHLNNPYPVVRWTDQWGTRWEHKRGVVRNVQDGDPWEL